MGLPGFFSVMTPLIICISMNQSLSNQIQDWRRPEDANHQNGGKSFQLLHTIQAQFCFIFWQITYDFLKLSLKMYLTRMKEKENVNLQWIYTQIDSLRPCKRSLSPFRDVTARACTTREQSEIKGEAGKQKLDSLSKFLPYCVHPLSMQCKSKMDFLSLQSRF